ncbi:hypothetical protein B7463_g12381, partial [Scytalidium lignicola]
MAGTRILPRRLLQLFGSRIVHVLLIIAVLGFSTQFLIIYTSDPSFPPYRVRQPRITHRLDSSSIDWSEFKYVQYATSPESLCNAVMIWRDMEHIGSRGQRLMYYPSDWSVDEIDELTDGKHLTPIARLLHTAETEYYVKLRPIEELRLDQKVEERWPEAYTSLLAFNLTEYKRVLVFDSGSLLKRNIDELFLIPSAPVTMPYVYFGPAEGWKLSSSMVLIQPSTQAFVKVSKAVKEAKDDESDVDILNKLYEGKISMLPQRPYSLAAGEFRRQNHRAYLGNSYDSWDPDRVFEEAKFMHFFDEPMPKPWIRAPQMLLNKYMPQCSRSEWFGASDCRDRAMWFKLYSDYEEKRKAVCGAGFELKDQALLFDPDVTLEDESHSDEV